MPPSARPTASCRKAVGDNLWKLSPMPMSSVLTIILHQEMKRNILPESFSTSDRQINELFDQKFFHIHVKTEETDKREALQSFPVLLGSVGEGFLAGAVL